MKNSIPISILGTIAFVSISCLSDSTSPTAGVPNPSVHVSLLYSDENGNDLLNPDHTNAWNEDNIDIYYLIDGQKEIVFNPNLDNPKRFRILYHEENEVYFLGLWLSEHIEKDHTVTYVEFPNGETDTLKIRAEQKPNSVIRASKFWYNEELLFDKEETSYQDLGFYEFTKPTE